MWRINDESCSALSPAFYSAYAGCPEILTKPARPYVCLAVTIDGVRFAIPIRHHIPHQWAFFTIDRRGLDYTKAVVLSRPECIGSTGAWIEQAEFDLLKKKERMIINGMRHYLQAYKKALRYPDNLHYENIRSHSALQYFHRELRLPRGDHPRP